MIIYAIKWGYSSSNGYEEYGPFWSTKDKAMKYLLDDVNVRGLEQRVSRKTKELIEVWSDGDYYIHIEEVKVDDESIY